MGIARRVWLPAHDRHPCQPLGGSEILCLGVSAATCLAGKAWRQTICSSQAFGSSVPIRAVGVPAGKLPSRLPVVACRLLQIRGGHAVPGTAELGCHNGVHGGGGVSMGLDGTHRRAIA
jgi:hypothetical protein